MFYDQQQEIVRWSNDTKALTSLDILKYGNFLKIPE